MTLGIRSPAAVRPAAAPTSQRFFQKYGPASPFLFFLSVFGDLVPWLLLPSKLSMSLKFYRAIWTLRGHAYLMG